MPFKSEAQRRYFEANKATLTKQGINVKEWEESSKGLKLPERAPKTKTKGPVSRTDLLPRSVFERSRWRGGCCIGGRYRDEGLGFG
jgi:hypothetical protein